MVKRGKRARHYVASVCCMCFAGFMTGCLAPICMIFQHKRRWFSVFLCFCFFFSLLSFLSLLSLACFPIFLSFPLLFFLFVLSCPRPFAPHLLLHLCSSCSVNLLAPPTDAADWWACRRRSVGASVELDWTGLTRRELVLRGSRLGCPGLSALHAEVELLSPAPH